MLKVLRAQLPALNIQKAQRQLAINRLGRAQQFIWQVAQPRQQRLGVGQRIAQSMLRIIGQALVVRVNADKGSVDWAVLVV